MVKKPLGKKGEKKVIKANRPARADWKEGVKKKQVGVSDMTLLSKITNEAINENLMKRWQNGDIYTYIGHVLISVNPFKDLGIYTDAILSSYRGKNLLEMPPHVFAIAESSYHHMNSYKENQCIIISGESGAGKTEAAKRIMQYIAAVSGDGASSSIKEIKEMVLATNPLLESFGCAKTLRNDNSSRHGKYLEIQFNSQGEPVGAVITNYLLEKNRVVGQIENERNFHVFYQLTKAAPPEYQEAYGLQGPESFLYTSRSNCLDVSSINDVNDFQDTLKAMAVIGLSKEEQDEIFKMLAIILWLGNVMFAEDDNGNAVIADADVANFIAYLMEVDSESLSKALTSRVMETQRGGRRGSVYEVPLNITQATAVRDALSKAIYERLFEWIVARVNVSLQTRGAAQYVIGVLDIYGFEIFEDNSFEQMCINYVNEKLQQIFIELTLKAEQEEYVREQIQWTPIKFFNNKVVCDLIEEKRPPGIFAALNDACATAHADSGAADNSFVQRLGFLSSNPHFESRGSKFLVRHYAGDVLYNVEGMTDKNKDSLLKDLLNLAAGSSNQFISQTLFPERIDPNSKKRPPTAGDKIKSSCNALVAKLMQCHPSYIRTIKPNDNRSSTEYDQKRVLHQVQYLGLCENIRVRRAGFAYRTTFEKFVERFYLLCPNTGYAGEYIWHGDAVSGAMEILKHNNIPADEWQMGTSKIFIRHPETIFALENLRDKYWHNMATRIQRAWRAYVRYKHECARKIQRFWRQNKYNIGYLQMREYGHQILSGRKERKRYSLLSMRRFTGDYLDVGSGSGVGKMVRNAINLRGGEEVVFSMRGSMLVPRAMRSSVPSPRTFVLTNQNLHIVMTTKSGKVVQMVDEKVLSLNIINSVSVSTLRDDWMVLHLDSSPDGDCIIHCNFKTELMAHMLQQSGGRIRVNVEPQIQYKKKGGKMVTMKFVKDEKVQGDAVYKSHVVQVSSGEPPNSQSYPPCAVKPKTTSSRARTTAARKPAAARSAPRSAAAARPVSNVQSISSQRPTPPPPAAAAAAPAPPSPPAAPSPTLPQYKAIYPFQSQEEGEIAFEKDDILEIVEKDENGWWLARKDGREGWVPSNYLEEYVAPKRAPPPPAPPARRPAPAAPRPASNAGNGSFASPRASMNNNGPVHVMPGMGGPPPSGGSGIPPWKAQLEARKASSEHVSPTPTPGPRPGSANAGPTPAARRVPPAPAPKPAIPVKPSTMSKPVVPARPGAGGAPSPAPRAPPRPGSSTPASNAAASLADAIRARRQQATSSHEADDDW
ncbi:P-loop containing nucleoside triphosphate hydrolase protein [Radiomyces spectabilis]|uniref:P-loop containing nucleoside triphosphate hydrolase protein n=1 Tax=Radiomyces spectabilis TaxID=64574 RepID=UPI0022209098|nr:P-loop containing nucleoside triphosphate hydrolase protein [Radiomyces spectabilis]KAI8391715.1 P-loop containing nucleoside triphosphate hydrolase protein [Radiomyces spectabilis]